MQKTALKLPRDSGTPVHKIRPKWVDVLLRLDPFCLITTMMVLLTGNLSLFKRGWPVTARLGIAVDRGHNPIPWVAYSAFDFLDNWAAKNPNAHIFEYGVGQSTLWWAARAKHITVVEHDERWIKAYQDKLPDNVTLHHKMYNSGYEEVPLASKKKFDLIMVDGMNRPACIPHAIKALKKGGLLIWDDSHYPRYAKHLQKLRDDDWQETIFEDHGPVKMNKTRMSVFRRNCDIT